MTPIDYNGEKNLVVCRTCQDLAYLLQGAIVAVQIRIAHHVYWTPKHVPLCVCVFVEKAKLGFFFKNIELFSEYSKNYKKNSTDPYVKTPIGIL